MKAVKSVAGNILTKLMVYPLGFIGALVLARLLGPELRGVFAFFILLVGIGIPVFSLGFGAGLTFYLRSKAFRIEDSLLTILLFSVLVGIVLSILFQIGVFCELFPPYILRLDPSVLVRFSMVLLLSSLNFFISRFLIATSNFNVNNLMTTVDLCTVPVLLAISSLYTKEIGMDVVVNILVVSKLIVFLSSLIAVILKFSFLWRVDRAFLRCCLKYGMRSWVGDVAVRMNARFDQIIIGFYLSSEALGIYSVATSLAEIIWIIPDSVSIVLVNSIISNNFSRDILKTTVTASKVVLLASIVVAISISILSEILVVPVFLGEAYHDVGLLLPILLAACILLIPAKFCTKILVGEEHIWLTSKATMFGTIVSIVSYFLLIPKFELLGAACATFFGYAAVSAFCLYYGKATKNISIATWFNLSFRDFIDATIIIKNIFLKRKLEYEKPHQNL